MSNSKTGLIVLVITSLKVSDSVLSNIYCKLSQQYKVDVIKQVYPELKIPVLKSLIEEVKSYESLSIYNHGNVVETSQSFVELVYDMLG